MNMIEKVARAIYDRMNDGDCLADFGLPMRDAILAARASIEAMREPSRAMYDSSGLNQIIDYHTFSRAWNNGIDAALKEE